VKALTALIEHGGERVQEHAELGARTTYRVGGSVRALVTLHSISDVQELGPLMRSTGLALVAIGNGSNLLVDDGEHEVLAVALEGEFTTLQWRDDSESVIVDAGAGRRTGSSSLRPVARYHVLWRTRTRARRPRGTRRGQRRDPRARCR